MLTSFVFLAWLPGEFTSEFTTSQPQFWFGNSLGWSILARVHDQVYSLFGAGNSSSSTAAILESGNYTSTHSIFELTAGDAAFTLDFFSPVSLTDYVRQSLPFSYLTVTASPLNGATPDINIYSDIDDSWIGSPGGTQVNHTTSGETSIYQLNDPSAAPYTQSSNENALWGTAVYATQQVTGKTLQAATGSSSNVLSSFYSNGSLTTSDTTYSSGYATAFNHQLGSVSGDTSVRFAVGVVREKAINYLGAAQTGYYRTNYSDTVSALTAFFDDYDAAASEAESLDSEIQDTATSIAGTNYADILTLSLRQIFGGIDVTVPLDSLSTDSTYAFIKEISSDGNVNTVDVIFPALPFFYVHAPEYIRLLLEPVTEYLNSGRWTQPFAIHDIGTNYPNATGHDDGEEEDMPVEESGNLLILAYAYQKVTGNTDWAAKYSKLFSGYADYLLANGLYPVNQFSTNDGLGTFTNMTNLGIKAAVGLAAYGALTGNDTLTTQGESFASTIDTIGVGLAQNGSLSYYTTTYGNDSWFNLFNIYADVLLDLNVFPDTIYANQSAFYPTVRSEAGVAIDGEVQWGKTDWQIWAAGSKADTSTRDLFINDLHDYISNGKNTMPFSDRYWVAGDQVGEGVVSPEHKTSSF